MNRKQILSVTTITAFAAILLAWAPSAAYAGNGGAAVIHEFGCNLFDGDGDLVAATQVNIAVDSEGDTTTLVCTAQGVDPSPTKRPVIQEGFGCNTLFGFTTDTRSVVTSSGVSILTCHINPSS